MVTGSIRGRVGLARFGGPLVLVGLLVSVLVPVGVVGAQQFVPNLVSSPQVVVLGGGQVRLGWGPPVGDAVVERYEYAFSEQVFGQSSWVPPVDRVTGSSGDRSGVVWFRVPGGGGARSVVVSNLTVGSSYQFFMRAVNAAGAGNVLDMGPTAAGHRISSVAPAPAGLRAVVADSQVTLMWTKARGTGPGSGFSEILRYEYAIKQGDGRWSKWSPMPDLVVNRAVLAAGERDSFVVSGLVNDVGYSFRVRAVNKNGHGAVGQVRPVVVGGAPGAPRNFVVTPGDASALLSWSAPGVVGSPITGWEVRWSNEDYTSLSRAVWRRVPGGAGVRSYYTSGLDNTQDYLFEVRAINVLGAGLGTRSGYVDLGRVPSIPPNFTTGTVTASSVQLSWDAPADEGDSMVVRYEYSVLAGDGQWGRWAVVPGGATTQTYTVLGLTAGVGYRFRVRAVNNVGPGVAAVTVGVVYPGTVPPAPVLTVEAMSDYSEGLHQAVLSWEGGDGGSPITKWQFRRSETVDGLASAEWYDLCDNTMGADPGCAGLGSKVLPTGRVPNGFGGTACPDECDPSFEVRDHYFVVRAVNKMGNGLLSGVVRLNFPKGVPAKSQNLFLRGYTADPRTDGRPHLGVAGGGLNGGRFSRVEYSWRVGDGQWGPWVILEGSISRATERFDEVTFQVGETYTVRRREMSELGAGYVAEMEPFIFGAPSLPGAADWSGSDTRDRPEVLAVPGNGRVRLNIVQPRDEDVTTPTGASSNKIVYVNAFVDTKSTYSDTVWEFSYRPAGGQWSPWVVANVGERFAGRASGSTSVTTDGVAVSGLRNGVAYEFRVRGVNSHGIDRLPGVVLYSNGAGLGSKSAMANPDKVVIPGVNPPAPAGLTASGGDGQVTLSWTSAGSGGPPIIRWEYSQQSRAANANDFGTWGSWTPVPGSGPAMTQATIRGLTNGSSYRFRLRAVNALADWVPSGQLPTGSGNGAAAQSLEVVPGKVPSAPQRVTAMPGDGGVMITVVSPIRGSAALGYEVRVRRADSDVFDAWEALGARITPPARHLAETAGVPVRGLVNGVSYVLEVRAVNQFGPGPAAASNPVTPIGAPGAGSLQATAGDRQVTLSWTPADTGGSTVSGWQYRMKTDAGGYGSWTAVTDGATARSLVVDDLANGRMYTFQIRATTTDSEVIGAAFTSAAATPSTVPPAPTLAATPANMKVTLNWAAGESGAVGEPSWAAPVSGWQYRMKTGSSGYGAWVDVPAATVTRGVGELTNGTVYMFEVRAQNKMGPGAAATATATPATVPDPPAVTATAGDRMVTVGWTAAGDGGSAVTGWQLRTGTGQWVDHPAGTTSVPVQNLVNGTSYTFQVRALNAMGTGIAGMATAMPATTPAAPMVVTSPGDGTVTLSWTPGTDGGSAVMGWHLRVDDGQWQDLTAMGLGTNATSVPVPNLVNGTSYTFHLRARSAVGLGAVATVSAIPAAVPAAPTVAATATDGTITVSWTASGDSGSAVTGWQWRTRIGSAGFGDWADVAAATMSTVISGVDAGTAPVGYVFEVRAINAVGTGPAGISPTITPGSDTPTDGEVYYSGPVTGPNFCAEFSLGGARLFALDSDGDGVADVCSLPYTRREAIARQNAIITLANRYSDQYRRLVNAECANQPGNESCGGDTLAAPGYPPPNDGGPYYSGTITGPSYCANRSLGGPTTYPLDGDGDGVADVCSLPYTRREAVARQKAGDTLAATHRGEYRTILAEECRRLGRSNYGDNPQDLNNDTCN